MTEKLSKLCNKCVVCKKSPKKYQAKYTSSNMSLHSFPSNPEKRQIWLSRCGLTDKEVLPFGKICSFHFKPSCFKSSKLKRRLLHPDTVPTIFIKDRIKKTNMPLKNNKGKPKNFNKNEIPLKIIEGQNGQTCGTSATNVITDQNCWYCNEMLEYIRNLCKMLSEIKSLHQDGPFFINKAIIELNKKKLFLESLRESRESLMN